MAAFSPEELQYLAEAKLGRLATIGTDGSPHVVPVGWRHNEELGTIDVGGRDPTSTQKYRNAAANPSVALVIDDVLPPWQPRCVMIRGTAEAVAATTGPDGAEVGALIRITPTKVVSWGLGGG